MTIYLRMGAILVQSLYCLAIFGAGVVTEEPFFYTFIGPAILLAIIAFTPRFLFDVIAVATVIMILMIALIFAAVVTLFNHDFLTAFIAVAIPVTCLATMIYCMERLKKEDAAYAWPPGIH